MVGKDKVIEKTLVEPPRSMVTESKHWLRMPRLLRRHWLVHLDNRLREGVIFRVLVETISLFSLVDSGFTHSYILSDLASELGIPVEVISLGMTVTSSFSESIVVNQMEIVVVRERPEFLSNVVSMTKTEKIMGKGCEAYLSYGLNSSNKELRVQDICTVRDFPDMLLKELSSLLPGREVLFGIKLFPSTVPVSIASYHMVTKDLKELKIQLQELLDRGFIRPSASTWSALVL
ncbi:uncharacterized protein LOC128040483 [Gossypium raimondii]|uniref:uncharacterized protein LOC128040483 n=1 Tax=Gossypium raimondii TaxID=29730 RepID=UPI00227B134F|nr:uncharacterized protein LOC128040483 [Gossypium raimondii]